MRKLVVSAYLKIRTKVESSRELRELFKIVVMKYMCMGCTIDHMGYFGNEFINNIKGPNCPCRSKGNRIIISPINLPFFHTRASLLSRTDIERLELAKETADESVICEGHIDSPNTSIEVCTGYGIIDTETGKLKFCFL